MREFRGIFPDGTLNLSERSETPITSTPANSQVRVAGLDLTATSQWIKPSTGTGEIYEPMYAIRFAGAYGDLLRSAYRYQLRQYSSGSGSVLVIEVRARTIGTQDLAVTDIVDGRGFWEQNSDQDVVRYFPVHGYKQSPRGFPNGMMGGFLLLGAGRPRRGRETVLCRYDEGKRRVWTRDCCGASAYDPPVLRLLGASIAY